MIRRIAVILHVACHVASHMAIVTPERNCPALVFLVAGLLPGEYALRVSEIVHFVNRGASAVTPAVVERLLHKLPIWKAEFTQINEPRYPHLVDQLEFLAEVVEDCAEGVYKDLPYCALAGAVFALIYAHNKFDIIPDYHLELGRGDDSSVVRAVLIQYEKAFAKYAKTRGIDWNQITSEA
ncbi:MAG: hypothetical protein N3G20_02845 [Verrucomicrobiae bacterium]|nr:hypothetical protein [Verrucomicrobiae bacterium]